MKRIERIKQRFHFCTFFVLAFCGIFFLSSLPAKAESRSYGISVNRPTKEEIKKYISEKRIKLHGSVKYETMPDTEAPFEGEGSLQNETLNEAVTFLNFIRYVAGIGDNVILSSDYNRYAQAASYVNYLNGVLSHYPTKPDKTDEDIYKRGNKGAGSSNLALGYGSIVGSILGYMNDSSIKNIDRVGHRRWILNPGMGAVGFGFCHRFSALYVFDGPNSFSGGNGVVWPAQNMPTELFSGEQAWSISLKSEIQDGIQVVLKKLSDNRTWTFSRNKSDGYFTISREGYGRMPAIIFRPDGIASYRDGDRYEVTITGLDRPISYKVSFFDAFEKEKTESSDSIPNDFEEEDFEEEDSEEEDYGDGDFEYEDSEYEDSDMEESDMEESDEDMEENEEEKVPVRVVIKEGGDERLAVGEYIVPNFTVIPLNATEKELSLRAKHGDIVKIDSDRKIYAKKSGVETIFVTSSSGEVFTSFQMIVLPKKGKIKEIKKKNKNLVLKFKKEKGIDGYELIYARNKAMKKGFKKVLSKKAVITLPLSGYQGIYYFQVRCFIRSKSGNHFGSFSKKEKFSIAK